MRHCEVTILQCLTSKTGNVTFRNVYSSVSEKVPVYAGLAPINPAVAILAPASLMTLFSITYSMGFITDPRVVTGIPPKTCSGNDCSAVFLPGGLELVYLDPQEEFDNTNFFNQQELDDLTSILVYDAPGFQVEFSPVESNYTFDPEDCKMYGETVRDGFYICLASRGSDLLAGG